MEEELSLHLVSSHHGELFRNSHPVSILNILIQLLWIKRWTSVFCDSSTLNVLNKSWKGRNSKELKVRSFFMYCNISLQSLFVVFQLSRNKTKMSYESFLKVS